MRRTIIIASLASVVSMGAIASEKDKSLTADAELGIIVTSGNTETSSAKFKISADHELESWRNKYLFDGLLKKDEVVIDATTGAKDTQTTAEKYFISAEGHYKLENPDQTFFLFSSYEDDKFSGFNYQSSVALGYGHRLWKDEKSSFEYNIGPGYSYNEKNDDSMDQSLIVRASATYRWNISETSDFTQVISTEAGDHVKSKSESSLTAKINGSLAMKLSLILKHNSEVPVNKEKLDTETAVTLVYTFN